MSNVQLCVGYSWSPSIDLPGEHSSKDYVTSSLTRTTAYGQKALFVSLRTGNSSYSEVNEFSLCRYSALLMICWPSLSAFKSCVTKWFLQQDQVLFFPKDCWPISASAQSRSLVLSLLATIILFSTDQAKAFQSDLWRKIEEISTSSFSQQKERDIAINLLKLRDDGNQLKNLSNCIQVYWTKKRWSQQ